MRALPGRSDMRKRSSAALLTKPAKSCRNRALL
jgi:hypothetical protein